LSLAEEPRARVVVLRVARLDHLHRDARAIARVARLEDGSHAAAAEDGEDLVRADALGDRIRGALGGRRLGALGRGLEGDYAPRLSGGDRGDCRLRVLRAGAGRGPGRGWGLEGGGEVASLAPVPLDPTPGGRRDEELPLERALGPGRRLLHLIVPARDEARERVARDADPPQDRLARLALGR